MDNEESRIQSAPAGSSPTSGPRSAKPKDAVDAKRHQPANIPAPFARESALIDHLITVYASLFDSAVDLSLADTRYERPRAVPAVPKKGLLEPMKQRGSISTRVINKSKPVSRDFRGLRLDTQHSTQPICNTQSDQESPDWACQTSLAVEAGVISMDSAYMRRQSSTPRHILGAMRSPTKVCLIDRKRVQSFEPGGKEAIYSAPPSKHSFTYSAASRHSEGALQLVRGVNAAPLVRKFERLEVAIEREPVS